MYVTLYGRSVSTRFCPPDFPRYHYRAHPLHPLPGLLQEIQRKMVWKGEKSTSLERDHVDVVPKCLLFPLCVSLFFARTNTHIHFLILITIDSIWWSQQCLAIILIMFPEHQARSLRTSIALQGPRWSIHGITVDGGACYWRKSVDQCTASINTDQIRMEKVPREYEVDRYHQYMNTVRFMYFDHWLIGKNISGVESLGVKVMQFTSYCSGCLSFTVAGWRLLQRRAAVHKGGYPETIPKFSL